MSRLGRLRGRILPHPVREARQRVDLGGVLIDRVNLGSAVERVRDFLRSGRTNQIVTVNLDFVAISRREPSLPGHAQRRGSGRRGRHAAGLGLPDGRRAAAAAADRRRPGRRVLPGGAGDRTPASSCWGRRPGVADAAAQRLRERFPGLRIVGVYAPPFGPLTERRERADPPDDQRRAAGLPVRGARCAAAGHVDPGQPRSAGRPGLHGSRLRAGPAGRGRGRAPGWMQHAGLEWLFRLLQEPARLWRRYIVDDLPVLAWLVKQAIERHASPSPPLSGVPVRRPG